MHDAGQSSSFVCLQLLVMRVGSDWIHPAVQFTRSHPPHEVATGGLPRFLILPFPSIPLLFSSSSCLGCFAV
ncbi:hypothetical protein HDV57DRAFT_502216, partial [Trichoderma longibrachiatum]